MGLAMREEPVSRSKRRLRFSKVAFSLIAVGAAAYAITAFVGYQAVQEMARHADARHQAMETLLLVERTMGRLVDLETGQRGFMLSGRDEFLEPFFAARQSLLALYPQLLRRMAASPSTDVRALQPTIDALVQRRLTAADAAVQARRRWGPDASREMGEHLHGKTLMDSLRTQFAMLQARQSAELARRSDESAQLSELTASVVAVLTTGGTALMLAALALMHHERARRERASRLMRRATERIDEAVSHRTSALSGAMQQMQSFTVQLDQRIEEERRRLAREVHDQLGQLVTAAKMVAREIARAHPGVPPAAMQPLTDLLDQTIEAARRISAELRPPMLDELGLAAAVRHHLKHVAGVGRLDAACEVADDDRLTAAQANQLFRILQEATTNVLRHAQARRLVVRGEARGLHY